jgi:hypothetical protein
MLIRSQINRDGEGPLSGFVWAGETDPAWIRFRTDPRSGVMSGLHLTPCEGTVPRGTPFRFRFQNGEQAMRGSEGVAMLILGQLARDPVRLEGDTTRVASPQAQLAAWESFLGGGSEPAAAVTAERRLLLPRDVFNRSLSGVSLFRRTGDGELVLNRSAQLRLGAPLSGFDTLTAVRDRSLPFRTGPVGELDLAQAREALAAVERPSPTAVAWYATARGDLARYRMQAAKAMPILAGLIAESRDLSRAVDACEPIQPILSERTGLPKASVKRITRLTVPVPAAPLFEAGEAVRGEDALGVNRTRRFSVSGVVSIDKALRHLAELAPDRTPQNDREWAAYYDVLTGCAIPIANAFDLSVRELLDASKGNWVEYRATLARAADFDPDRFDRRTMALTTIDAIEAIEGFSRTALMPQVLSSITETGEPVPAVTGEFLIDGFEASAKLILGNAKNVAAHLFEVARRYAGRIPAMMEAEGRLVAEGDPEGRFDRYGETAFPLLTETFVASNGLLVRPLRNFDELKAEGQRMSHCVGGYTTKARDARCHLYSIRSPDETESLSTLELTGLDGEDAVTAAANIGIVQNRARRNGAPSAEAKAATDEFMRALKGGEIPIRFEEIRAWKRLRAQGQNGARVYRPETTWESVLEHDWRDQRVRNALWAEWRTVMGGRVAKANNPGVVYTERATRDLVASMSPRAAAILLDRERAAREQTPTPA